MLQAVWIGAMTLLACVLCVCVYVLWQRKEEQRTLAEAYKRRMLEYQHRFGRLDEFQRGWEDEPEPRYRAHVPASVPLGRHAYTEWGGPAANSRPLSQGPYRTPPQGVSAPPSVPLHKRTLTASDARLSPRAPTSNTSAPKLPPPPAHAFPPRAPTSPQLGMSPHAWARADEDTAATPASGIIPPTLTESEEE